jgi:hypothetical protein
MVFIRSSHLFRQAQYDLARCQSELVEDIARATLTFLNII